MSLFQAIKIHLAKGSLGAVRSPFRFGEERRPAHTNASTIGMEPRYTLRGYRTCQRRASAKNDKGTVSVRDRVPTSGQVRRQPLWKQNIISSAFRDFFSKAYHSQSTSDNTVPINPFKNITAHWGLVGHWNVSRPKAWNAATTGQRPKKQNSPTKPKNMGTSRDSSNGTFFFRLTR